jgi:hypothetical protein
MNKLNNIHSQKYRIKKLSMTKKIPNCFSAYFSSAYQLTNNLKRQGKTFTRNSKTPMSNNFKEIFYTNFSEEELKEAICKHQSEKIAQTRQHLPRIHPQPRPKSNEDTTIYDKFWNSRDNLPDKWKKAIIVPTPKPDKPQTS